MIFNWLFVTKQTPPSVVPSSEFIKNTEFSFKKTVCRMQQNLGQYNYSAIIAAQFPVKCFLSLFRLHSLPPPPIHTFMAVGKPIQCWIPQEFTRGWEEYAENYCWVANTYFAPVEKSLPPVPDRYVLNVNSSFDPYIRTIKKVD
ncbi:unnamed protein product [Protopolystoma xenopodis]|uniref:Innexin n=1 Tax=Protopolystoma xenopodis TaxID=117903 RepID=A0A3S5CKL5_9PLAT|nr:unnamed protein product [Protopolystoma xenopodis]